MEIHCISTISPLYSIIFSFKNITILFSNHEDLHHRPSFFRPGGSDIGRASRGRCLAAESASECWMRGEMKQRKGQTKTQ